LKIIERLENLGQNSKAKNASKFCIKLCATGIFGCRICICSIWCARL